jgi:GT2 family glycosyltransferase
VLAAQSRAALLIQLDPGKPFTAARARNEGAFAAIDRWPGLEYFQFIDGDCVLHPGWMSAAFVFLAEHPDVAIVCGRRRERFPHNSIYNELCDHEWNTPIGNASACGGDAMIRTAAFLQVEGYLPELIAGEEPEMCARMRAVGWRIWRLDPEMTKHDAAMLRFSQWWKRAARSGYAEFDVWLRSLTRPPGAPDERRQVFRSVFWGFLYPMLVTALSFMFSWKAFAALALYGIQIVRIAMRRGIFSRASWAYAVLMVLAKFAGLWGILVYIWRSVLAKPALLIEYKEARTSR